LTKRFGEVAAVDRVSREGEEGEVYGFRGPNGAGKTATVGMLASLVSKTGDTAEVADGEIGRKADDLQLLRRIGVLPENIGLYEGNSSYQNLEYLVRLHRL
jgi:ABC-2 type transport system ATP-binding protein